MRSVPAAQFDYQRFPPEDRLPAFRQMTASLYDTWALGKPDDFRAVAFGHQVGDLIFNEVEFSPARFRRNQTHTMGGSKGFLCLQAQLAGDELLVMDHGVVRLFPGHIYLRDWAYPFDSKATAMHMHTLVIPRHRLPSSTTLSRNNPVLEWQVDNPEGRMLFKLWLGLIRFFPSISLGKAELLCTAFLGFLDGLLGGNAAGEQPATLHSMEQFLTSRLSGDVGVADLCRQFNVSRSTVYRLFGPHGGVGAYLGRMRLERAYANLRQADPARVHIAEIAACWRFSEPSSFSRKFRQQFGLPPSEVLGKDFEDKEFGPDGIISGADSFSSYANWLNRASNPTS